MHMKSPLVVQGAPGKLSSGSNAGTVQPPQVGCELVDCTVEASSRDKALGECFSYCKAQKWNYKKKLHLVGIEHKKICYFF